MLEPPPSTARLLLRFTVAVVSYGVACLVTGLAFVLLPCYVAPSFGKIQWCGYKSAPPHAETQFWVGVAVGAAIIWLLRRRRSR